VLQYHFNWKTISVAAGMTLWNFYFQLFEKAVGKEETVLFLGYLIQRISSPLLIVWDRLPAHRSRLVGEFLDQLQGWIVTEYLPPYAPELNPVEYLGALEAARTAQRLSAAPVAIERSCPANPAAPAPTPATRTSFLETVFPCF